MNCSQKYMGSIFGGHPVYWPKLFTVSALVGWLFVFYGISTSSGNLMVNPFYRYVKYMETFLKIIFIYVNMFLDTHI